MQRSLTLGTDKTKTRLKQTTTKALSSQGSVLFPSEGLLDTMKSNQTNKVTEILQVNLTALE